MQPVWNRCRQMVVCRMRGSASKKTDGFVNCRQCGSDVAIPLTEFEACDYTEIRCFECGREWEADLSTVYVLYGGEICKATELLNEQTKGNKKAAEVMQYFRRSIRIWVGNLPTKMNETELQTMFERYGEVKSTRVIYDRTTRRSRGFAFVEMADEGEGLAAIQDLHGRFTFGKRIAVRKADSD